VSAALLLLAFSFTPVDADSAVLRVSCVSAFLYWLLAPFVLVTPRNKIPILIGCSVFASAVHNLIVLSYHRIARVAGGLIFALCSLLQAHVVYSLTRIVGEVFDLEWYYTAGIAAGYTLLVLCVVAVYGFTLYESERSKESGGTSERSSISRGGNDGIAHMRPQRSMDLLYLLRYYGAQNRRTCSALSSDLSSHALEEIFRTHRGSTATRARTACAAPQFPRHAHSESARRFGIAQCSRCRSACSNDAM
jgi:hypothetical protein